MTMADTEIQDAIKPIPPPSETAKQRKRRASASSSTKKSSSAKSITIAQLQSGLKSSFELLGLGLMGFDAFDGQVVHDKAGDMAEALTELAKVNPRVRSVLESLMGAGAWSGVIAVIGAQVALPIAVHHNLLPTPINETLAVSGDIPVKPRKGKLKVIDGENNDMEGTENGKEA